MPHLALCRANTRAKISTTIMRVDHGARRHIIFAGNVADAEQDRGQERTGDTRRAAHGHDDQKVDHVFERKDRIETKDLGAERAAKAGEPRADRERQPEHHADVDAEAARHALIIDRRAQPAAEARARADELQRDRKQRADADDEQPIAPDADAEHVDLTLQRARDHDELLRGAHGVVDRRHRHEDQPDSEQHLVEMALGIDVHIERSLQ
jgi:hypothetical protein